MLTRWGGCTWRWFDTEITVKFTILLNCSVSKKKLAVSYCVCVCVKQKPSMVRIFDWICISDCIFRHKTSLFYFCYLKWAALGSGFAWWHVAIWMRCLWQTSLFLLVDSSKGHVSFLLRWFIHNVFIHVVSECLVFEYIPEASAFVTAHSVCRIQQ